MVATLRELYAKSKHPSHEDQESAAQTLAHIIEQAQVLGHEYAEQQRQSKAWGGNFLHALQSAWLILDNFTKRISTWIGEQVSAGANPSPADIQAEIDTVATHVADFEVHAAIESEVVRELTFAGVKRVRTVAQPDACDECKAKADAGPVPIDGYDPPPFHGGCRCITVSADGERILRAEPRLMSQQGTCDCEICRSMAGKPVGEKKPPFHEGCSCSTREASEEDQ